MLSTVGTPGRDVNFNDKAASLSDWSTRAARTGRMVAAGGSGGNKKLAESLVSAASQVSTSQPLRMFYYCFIDLLICSRTPHIQLSWDGGVGVIQIKSNSQRSKTPSFRRSSSIFMLVEKHVHKTNSDFMRA